MHSETVLLDHFALPEGAEADQLVQGLSRLIEQRGAETFLAAPLLLAEPRYFPEPIAPRAEGVATLLRRLLAYAGLSPTGIDVEIYDERQKTLVVDEADPHASAAAWFMDIADGVYRFGVRENELRDEQSLIGTLGHEVAHAYRSAHRLVVPTASIEEQLTDLTTVYLGFGAFTLESSYQFKAGGYDERGERLLYESHFRGYLRPGQLAFLLGVQLTLRGLRDEPVAPVLASLSLNQRAAVEQAILRLSPRTEQLLHELALPPLEEWPIAHELSDALVPLPETEVSIHDAPRLERERAQPETIAFRLAGTRAAWGAGLGFSSGFAGALMLNLDLTFWPLTFALGVLGLFVGQRRASPTCTACTHNVPVGASRCPRCSARLLADIRELADRFAAEEAHAQATAPAGADVAGSPPDQDSRLMKLISKHQKHNTRLNSGTCSAEGSE